MKFDYVFNVRFQDAGRRDRIRLSRFADMVINAIVKCADDNGDGLDVLRAHGAIWVLAKLVVEIHTVPLRDDELTFETWCERSGRGLSVRNVRVWKQDPDARDGRRLMAKVRTLWASIDITSREVCDVYERGVPKNEDGERLKMPKVSDEIGEMDDVTEDHHRVRYSDLDANGHCNSGRYFEILLDAIEPGEAFTPSRFEITYVKEAMLGQVLKVKWTQDALGYRFHVTTLSGETCCRAAIENADS